jgi:hypothetical protein
MNYKTFSIQLPEDLKEKSDEPQDLFTSDFQGLIIGRQGSGKSTLIERCLTNENAWYKKFDLTLFLSPNTIGELKIKEDRKHNSLNIDWILERIEYFKSIKKVRNVLIIIDDLVAHIEKSKKNTQLIDFVNNRRHIVPDTPISLIFTTQKYTMFPSCFRSTMNWIIMFPSPNEDLEILAKHHIYNKSSDKLYFIHLHWKKNSHNFIFLNSGKIFLNFEKLL